MSHLFFYYSSNHALLDQVRRAARLLWGESEEAGVSEFRLFMPASEHQRLYACTEQAVGAVSGYVRCSTVNPAEDGSGDDQRAHRNRLIRNLVNLQGWPLGNEWTGCFVAVAYSDSPGRLVVCNDLLGYIPIYFCLRRGEVIGGTSLVMLSRVVNLDPDPVGVLQRIHPYYPCCGANFGRRTIFKDVRRLLPGECISFSGVPLTAESRFDNSLCANVIDGDLDQVARRVWGHYQSETELACAGEESLSLALSGGWDSRLVLGAAASLGKPLTCLTYGARDIYEVKIAERCAEAVRARFQSYSLESKYFPSKQVFSHLVAQTEAAYIMALNAILEAAEEENAQKPLMLVGDLCDSLTGKGIRSHSSRNYKIKSFLDSLQGGGEEFEAASEENFEQWRLATEAEILRQVRRFVGQLAPNLRSECTAERIDHETREDLELDFSRVRANMPRFSVMFEELFTWFHYTRFGMASQLLLLGYSFRPVSPSMTMRFLRLISQVHPSMRLRRRLIDAVIAQPDFDILGRIPSAQVPFLSSRAPGVAKEIVWGIRAMLDDWFLKRTLRSGDPQRRHHFVKWHNLIAEYRRDDTLNRVRSWFSGRWITPDRFMKLVQDRADLRLWPDINADIAVPANVSLMLDLADPEVHLH
jgi:hypothetical protein